MNIGLGLIAADEYFKEGDRRQLREHQQALRDYERDMLPDKANAERSGYQLRNSQNNANSELLPSQTENAKKRIGLDSAELEGQAERQPTEIKTKGIQAGIGLANAENDQINVPWSLQVKNNGLAGQVLNSEHEIATLPQKLRMAATQGTLSEQGQMDVVLGTMGGLISRNDKAGALRFANEIAKTSEVLPGTNGVTFTDIKPASGGPQGPGYHFITSDGKTIFAPKDAIGGAMQKLQSGKYKFIERSDGSIFAGNEANGRGGIVQGGDPAMLRGKNAQHTPADIQSAEWLMERVPKFKGNPEAAWDAVRSSKEKTRSSFIMDYVSKNALPGTDSNKMAQEAGAMYDALRRNQGGGNSAPSNSGPVGKVDPAISSLIGIP